MTKTFKNKKSELILKIYTIKEINVKDPAYQLTNIFIYYKLDPISDKESSQMFIKMHGM